MKTFPEGEGLVEERQIAAVLPCAEHFSDPPSETVIPFHDRKQSSDGDEPRGKWRNEKQLHPDRFCKSSNASGMAQCHVFQYNNVARCQGRVFYDSAYCVLLFEPCLRAGLRPPSICTAVRTDNDIRVLFGFRRVYNGLASPRILKYVLSISPEKSLVDCKTKTEIPTL